MVVGIPLTGASVPSATSDVPMHSSLPTASAPAPPGPSTDAPFWRAPIRSTLLDRGARVAPAELERRVEARAAELGERRLVLLRGTAELALVVDLLACLRARCPVILTGPSDADDEFVDRFDPDVVLDAAARPQGSRLVERRPGSAHELHRDLALLLSTSGSTGAPKLVRLSRRNLASNAAAIASYLRLDAGDCAVTSLPLHYCYGLSVLTSHLAVGATVALSDLSVVDPCFWALCRDAGVTTIAGVPHTFELLDRIRFDGTEAPMLRRLTQAGGRMPPATVERYARLGHERGIDLYVMYGQTEATARMAYLPPELAATHPDAVGVAIPGGELELRPLPAEEAPEWPEGSGLVVYRGPNVMMGYAESPAELADPPSVDELVTGDVGRFDEAGLLHLEGRRSRFTKIFGLRIDLDDLERRLSERGVPALCVGDDRCITIAVVDGAAGAASAAAAQVTGLPPRRLRVVELGHELPRAANGKPDRSPLRDLAAAVDGPDVPTARAGGVEGVRDIYRSVLGLDHVGEADTFVSLGGDSLSYVEASVRLEERLGRVPDGWHLRTVGELESLSPRARRWPRVETGCCCARWPSC